MAATAASAVGLISMLNESNSDLKIQALDQLNSNVQVYWPELSDVQTLGDIEALAYDENTSKMTELAALVASKVHFHCNAKQSALTLALKAGNMFDLNEKSDYTQTVISAAIDHYIELRKDADSGDPASDTSNPYKDIVERLVKQSLQNKQSYDKIIGIALDSKRLDILETVLNSGDPSTLLPFLQAKCMNFVTSHSFRSDVYKLIYNTHKNLKDNDPDSLCQCLVQLGATEDCTLFLLELIKSKDDKDVLKAYQIGFDLYENAPSDFTKGVSQQLEKLNEDASQAGAELATHINKLEKIVSGEITRALNLHFLSHKSNVDRKILDTALKTFGTSSSVYNNAICLANSFMYAGTTDDIFMRKNAPWMQSCNQWSKFAVTASLGLIHLNHTTKAVELLQPYLPSENREERPYEEGGAFFALGLISANHHNPSVIKYLNDRLNTVNGASTGDNQRSTEVLYHGLCLGIGAAHLGNEVETPSDAGSDDDFKGSSTEGEDAAQKLYDILQTDSAVAGQAAAIGIGLCMMGSADSSMVEALIDYATETDHDKIILGIANSIALIMFDKQEKADSIINRLCEKEDPLLRLAGAQTISMAYCGTGSNAAVRRLLHLAVSDVNDDVRRSAAIGLGFVFLNQPEHIPRMVQLLSDSFNPNVRYGSALALGIACAGTGSADAISILEPMLKDSSDFVRQGVMIALAMILIQQNESSNSKVDFVRKKYAEAIADRYSDQLLKFGATVSQGILDAGGRNVSIRLTTKWGTLKHQACAGMFLFTQMWNWFPFAQFLSLTFTSTGLIGIDESLEPPRFDISCKGKKETFGYPPKTESTKKESKINPMLTQLSTTKTKSRTIKKAEAKTRVKSDDQMDLEPQESAAITARSADSGSDGQTKSASSANQSFIVSNMERILPWQEEYVEWTKNGRYSPAVSGRVSGIVILRDSQPSEPKDYINIRVLTEAPAPEPFEYPFPDNA